MSTLDSTSLGDATEMLAGWRRCLLVSHAKPDGDALGSLAAMRCIMQARGVDAVPVLFDPIPSRYAVFQRFAPMARLGTDLNENDLGDIDGVVILDTCTYSQLEPIADWLRKSAKPKLAVDHHVTRDDLADHYVIDESAAATCLILYEWAKAAGWTISPDTAEAMFIGMAMDTGWFQHANTDQRVLAASADLAAHGVRPHDLHEALFHRESPARVRLLGAAIDSMALHGRDRLAVMTLTADAIKRAGATPADTEDIVNEPLRIGSVVVSVLLVEQEPDLVRVSFRSKAPVGEASTPDIDVAKLAAVFGGGGHRRAAGARIQAALGDAVTQIVKHVEVLLPQRAMEEDG